MTYYLSSLDNIRLSATRACVLGARLADDVEFEGCHARVSPGIEVQDFGRGEPVEDVIIIPRHKGFGLFPIWYFPCFVFVCIPPPGKGSKTGIRKDLTIIGWGEVYRTASDADSHKFDPRP